MSFDGVFTHAMTNELQQLKNGKVAKIQQPYPNEVILQVRANRKNQALLLSAHPQYARVQITKIPYANPKTPSKFAMTLRKYLDGAVVNEIEQKENDRVISLSFSSRNELGDLQNIRLIVEMMGRHSNIILINQASDKIIDLVRHVPADQNRYRLLMPGAQYVAPPKQESVDPFDHELILDPENQYSPKFLQLHYQGLGKDSAVELSERLNQTSEPETTFRDFFDAFNAPLPTQTNTDKTQYFSAIDYVSEIGEKQSFDSLSDLLDHFYESKAENDRVQQLGGTLIHLVKTELKKDQRKVVKLHEELDQTEKADDFRVKGEILTTYLSQVKRGMTSITLPNFYNDNEPIEISLSNQLSPSKNAQKYFNRYQKLKNSIHYINEQLDETQQEIDYFEGILTQIQIASPKDLNDIQLELQEEGYLRVRHKKNAKKQKIKVNQPDVFYASDGTKIYVGKNNLQNDQLTLHKAAKKDTWLHAKNVPGSHVIISSSDPSDKTLMEAANIAAYFSKSRLSGTVPVDYIEVKRIHKPNGAKPGFVIYTGQKTVYVTPDESLINKLRTKPNL